MLAAEFLFYILSLPASAVLSPHLAQASTYDFTSTTTVREYILLQVESATSTAMKIAEKESGYTWNARGDMDILCANKRSPFYGKPIEARGVFQITKCYHPEITDEQADDVIWATAWALPLIADRKTCRQEWTTCRLLAK